MEKLNIGLLYISLHNQLIKNADRDKTIDRKAFFCIIGKHFLVPKNLRFIIIKEMVDKELIKQESNGKIKLINYNINIEEDANKIYKLAGLY